MPLISDKIQIPVQKGSAIIALILNTCLVLLIIRKSPKELGAYKFLMIYISILEVLYAIVDILVLPVITLLYIKTNWQDIFYNLSDFS